MSDIDDEPRGRSATGAVIIAVIFLAVLGTGVGILLGNSANQDKADAGAGSTGVPSATPTVSVTPSSGGSASAGSTRTRTPTNPTTFRPTTRDTCPQQTEAEVGSSLSVKLYIRTNRSEVWICQGGGRTVYQGHVIGTGFPSATSDTTRYIGSTRYEAGVYAAVNGDTTYFVSAERLRIEKNGTEQANEVAVDTYTG